MEGDNNNSNEEDKEVSHSYFIGMVMRKSVLQDAERAVVVNHQMHYARFMNEFAKKQSMNRVHLTVTPFSKFRMPASVREYMEQVEGREGSEEEEKKKEEEEEKKEEKDGNEREEEGKEGVRVKQEGSSEGDGRGEGGDEGVGEPALKKVKVEQASE